MAKQKPLGISVSKEEFYRRFFNDLEAYHQCILSGELDQGSVCMRALALEEKYGASNMCRELIYTVLMFAPGDCQAHR